MTMKRNRKKQTVSFDQRLHHAAVAARDAAGQLPDGQERERLLDKARQAEIAVRINAWLGSPNLAAPAPSRPEGLRNQSGDTSAHGPAVQLALQPHRE